MVSSIAKYTLPECKLLKVRSLIFTAIYARCTIYTEGVQQVPSE